MSKSNLTSYVLSKIERGGNEFGCTITGLTRDAILFEDAHLADLGSDGVQKILNELELKGLIKVEIIPGRGEVYTSRR